MKEQGSSSRISSSRRGVRGWVIAGLCLIVVCVLLLPRQREPQRSQAAADETGRDSNSAHASIAERIRKAARTTVSSTGMPLTAEEIVTNKLNQFARHRRELLRQLARHYNVEVPAAMEEFFDAAEAGRWDEVQTVYAALRERREREEIPVEAVKLWPVLLETLGVAEAVQKWPSQKLLDYGNSILDSLRPGMIYVGGTDPGRFIPTLLNDTGEGERHIVVTQNALADQTYLDYLRFLHTDRIPTLTKEDSERAFQEYMQDAQKRFKHDEDFPNEPKQIRPGEDIRMSDNKLQVSGQIAVMAINEKLLRMLMDKNPDASFAIEQSFPFTSMYGGTRPLGPIMELRAGEQNAFTQERAGQTVDYWRTSARELLSDTAAADAQNVRMTYGKMAAEQAALLQHHGYAAEAEQAFQIATEIAPASPEAVFRYMNILVGQKRFDDAIRITQAAITADVENQHHFDNLFAELHRLKNN